MVPLAAHGEYRQDARLGDGDLPELRYGDRHGEASFPLWPVQA